MISRVSLTTRAFSSFLLTLQPSPSLPSAARDGENKALTLSEIFRTVILWDV